MKTKLTMNKIFVLFVLYNTICSAIEVSKCNLKYLGTSFSCDKFDGGHAYEDLYCDAFEPVKDQELNMLEIGFGCGHRVHGASAKLWTTYFKKLKYYSIDYVPFQDLTFLDKTYKCVKDWPINNPGIVQKIYFGDQSNVTFLGEVKKNYPHEKIDIIIDDGGHGYREIKNSFLELWPRLSPGGLYVIEGLRLKENGGHQDDSTHHITIRKAIQHWIAELIRYFPEQRLTRKHLRKESNNYDPELFPFPKGLIAITCVNEACLLRKGSHTITKT